MFARIKHATVAHDVAQRIREKALSGDLAPGDRFPGERILAEEFGVSRSTIREAVRGLEQAGILAVRKGPRGGIFVASSSGRLVSDTLGVALRLERVPLAQLVEARADLECLIVRVAAEKATGENLEEMRRCIAEMEASSPSIESLRENNHRFHLAVVRASQNEVWLMLTSAMRDLVFQSVNLLSLDDTMWRRILDYHRKIVVAIQNRDTDAAEDVMRRHLSHFETELISHLGDDLFVNTNPRDE